MRVLDDGDVRITPEALRALMRELGVTGNENHNNDAADNSIIVMFTYGVARVQWPIFLFGKIVISITSINL